MDSIGNVAIPSLFPTKSPTADCVFVSVIDIFTECNLGVGNSCTVLAEQMMETLCANHGVTNPGDCVDLFCDIECIDTDCSQNPERSLLEREDDNDLIIRFEVKNDAPFRLKAACSELTDEFESQINDCRTGTLDENGQLVPTDPENSSSDGWNRDAWTIALIAVICIVSLAGIFLLCLLFHSMFCGQPQQGPGHGPGGNDVAGFGNDVAFVAFCLTRL